MLTGCYDADLLMIRSEMFYRVFTLNGSHFSHIDPIKRLSVAAIGDQPDGQCKRMLAAKK